jgi:hypothetical protein
MATVGTQHGQSRTDHLQACHLAVELIYQRMINSSGRRHLGPILHRTVVVPL